MTDRLTEKVNVLSWDCGLTNLAYCLLEYVNEPDREFHIRLWENFSLNELDIKAAVAALVRELDKRPWMIQADYVCIEEQVPKNSTMRAISHSLQTYFLSKCKTEEETNSNGMTVTRRQGPKVSFVKPQMKFKVCSVPDPEEITGHKKNKKIAVAMAKKVLNAQRDHRSLAYLESHKKQDDLADSFLQAIIFMRDLKKKKTVNENLQRYLGVEVTIEDKSSNSDDDMQPYVFRSENFNYPTFDVDGGSVSISKVFKREN